MWLLVVVVGLASALSFDCDAAPASPEDRRPNATRLVVGHWNVEWLFLSRWDRRWASREEAEEHLAAVAAVIRTSNVDVLHLAEVEDCSVVRRLAAAVARLGDSSYRGYLVKGTDTATGQNVALLTRVDPVAGLWRSGARASFPVAGSACASEREGSTGVSKHLVAVLQPRGFPRLSVVGAHLVARPSDPSRCAQREAQSVVLQGVVAQLLRDGPVVLLGDFNDFDGAVRDARASRPMARTLALLKDAVPARPGDELTNVARLVAPQDRFTAYFDPAPVRGTCRPARASSSSIDHILASTDLDVGSVAFRNAAFPPPCAGAAPVSDHWPIFATLRPPPTRTGGTGPVEL